MTPGRIGVGLVALLVLAGLVVLVRGTRTSQVVTPAEATQASVGPGPGVTTTAGPPVTASDAPTTRSTAPVRAVTPSTSRAPLAPSTPGPVALPTAGTFRYRFGGTSPTVEATLTISGGPGAGRQTFRTTSADLTEQEVVDWSASARTIVSIGSSPACTWAPGYVSLRLPLASGSAWKADSSCPQPTSAVHRTEDAAVKGATQTTVAGTAVAVWIIARHTVTEVTTTAGARAVVEAESSELFAPSLGLVVYQVTRTASPQPDGTTATTTQTMELLGTRPA